MTVASRYLIGLGAVGAGVLVAGVLVGSDRGAIWAAAAVALALQGPLGWWLLRAVGGPRFLQVWGAGLLGRLGLVALAGMSLVASGSSRAQAALIALAATLVALLGVEIAVLLGAPSTREDS